MDEPTSALQEPARRDDECTDPPRRMRGLTARVALAGATLLATVLVLEALARVVWAVAPVAPWQVRDGVYHHSLGLVNGLSWSTPQTAPSDARRLSRSAEENEIRVFVFGESSVQGSPWGVDVSAPAMLYDQLSPRLGDRQLTVVNMGRGGAMLLDTYYYLQAVARFEPDVIIFYQGTNDRFDSGVELCLPVNRPRLHALWRWHVEHSRLLWFVRARAPTLVRGERAGDVPGSSRPAGCSEHEGLSAWTDVVLGLAERTGAHVIVATPVFTSMGSAEYTRARDARERGFTWVVDHLEGRYRELVVCSLDADCTLHDAVGDLHAGDDAARPSPPADSDELLHNNMVGVEGTLEDLRQIWFDAAERHGASRVDFLAVARARAPRGMLLPPFMVDSVHLSLDGYALLAATLAATTEVVLNGAHRPADASTIPQPDTSRYVARLDRHAAAGGALDYCAINRSEGATWLQGGAMIVGVGLMQTAWETCHDETAGLALGWLHGRLDVPSSLPPAVVERAARVDVEALLGGAGRTPEMGRDQGASALGGPTGPALPRQ